MTDAIAIAKEMLDHIAVRTDPAGKTKIAADRIRTLAEAYIALQAEQIVAPAECDPNCDDPHCHYTHTPLTLRRAYENSLDRTRNAEANAIDLRAKLTAAEARIAELERDGAVVEIADRCAAEIMGNDHLRHRLDEQQQDEVHGDIQHILRSTLTRPDPALSNEVERLREALQAIIKRDDKNGSLPTAYREIAERALRAAEKQP